MAGFGPPAKSLIPRHEASILVGIKISRSKLAISLEQHQLSQSFVYKIFSSFGRPGCAPSNLHRAVASSHGTLLLASRISRSSTTRNGGPANNGPARHVYLHVTGEYWTVASEITANTAESHTGELEMLWFVDYAFKRAKQVPASSLNHHRTRAIFRRSNCRCVEVRLEEANGCGAL